MGERLGKVGLPRFSGTLRIVQRGITSHMPATPTPRFVVAHPTDAAPRKIIPYAEQFRTNPDGEQEKLCIDCLEWAPLSTYKLRLPRNDYNKKTGLIIHRQAHYDAYCAKCTTKRTLATLAVTKAVDPMRARWGVVRSGATVRGIHCPKQPPFTAAEMPSVCPVLGIPLNHICAGAAQGKGQYKSERDASNATAAHNTSFDRIDPNPNVGYVRSNLVVVSLRANALKGDATPEESLRVAAYSYREYAKRGLVPCDPIQDLIDACSKSKSTTIRKALDAFKKAAFP